MQVAGRKISSSTLMLVGCALGLGIVLFVVNYMHALNCASDRSPDEVEALVDALKSRLLESESKILKNELMMNRLIASMQSNLYKLEQIEYNALSVKANNEAVEVALMLAAHPAPPMPVFPLDEKYLKAEDLANAIDDIFSKEGLNAEYYTGELDGKLAKGLTASELADKDNALDATMEQFTDSEAIEKCKEWKDKYNVIVGASWGDLPYDLQQKWLEYSCDYHLQDEGAAGAAGGAGGGGDFPADEPQGGGAFNPDLLN